MKYINVPQKLRYLYNNSRYQSIGMKPADMNRDNESIVWQWLYVDKSTASIKYKFNIGDQVRISKARRTFEKGCLPNWTEEVFIITQRIPRPPHVYKIADCHGEELEGIFYERELQRLRKELTFIE